jgi:putative PIG3 family NAD(P)H quinone oxidoreductase
MRAVIAQEKRPNLIELPTPTIQADEVLVKVHATALNRADLLQVLGKYPPPPGWPETLGMELAGEVAQVGSEVTSLQVGQRVMALVGGGSYADYCAVPAPHCMVIPANLSYTEAAAIPEAFITAYSNLLEIGGLTAADTALIHAAASGVGLAAIQLAKTVGAHVIGTASAGKHALCLAQGADRMIDYQQADFAATLQAEGIEVDVILDFIGAAYWQSNLKVLKKWGTLVLVGLMGGTLQEVDLGLIMRKRLTITGSTLRDRPYDEKTALIGRFGKWALPHFHTGQFKPTVWQVYPLEAVEAAHAAMSSNQNAGKIVLTLSD